VGREQAAGQPERCHSGLRIFIPGNDAKGDKSKLRFGGITASIIDMYDVGQVRVVECSQSFDAVAAKAILTHPGVVEIDNAEYAGFVVEVFSWTGSISVCWVRWR